MKYIRTKDGRVKKLNEEIMKFFEGKKIFLASTFEEVIQANTIEELCDEFVLCCNGFVRPNLLNNSRFKDAVYLVKKHNEQAKSYIIYGAIWTDKGLIYVAKMNDKGELELL